MRKQERVIIFDFDGTLYDTSPGILFCLEYTILKKDSSLGKNILSKNLIGAPIRSIFYRIFPNKNEAFVDDCVKIFREKYKSEGIHMVSQIKGVHEVLRILQGRGLVLVIVSNKPKQFIIKILKRFKALNYFDYIFSPSENTDLSKSELLKKAVKKLKISSDNVVMIGDRIDDIITAKDNNITSIGVSYGYGSKNELAKGGASLVVNSPKEIIKALRL